MSERAKKDDSSQGIPYWAAAVPLIFISVALTTNFIAFGLTALDGPSQLVLMLGAFIAALIGMCYGQKWNNVLSGIVSTISAGLPGILIIFLIGALIAAWFVSGIIPTIVYLGVNFLSPDYFYISAVVICCVVSLAIGSSWSTSATVGVALFGIGESLSMNPGITVGAIISGAYFGDKMSPLSDTTNLASSITNVDLIKHIEYMRYTTTPALLITIGVLFFIGLAEPNIQEDVSISSISVVLDRTFVISPWLLIVPVLSGVMVYRRVPAMLVLAGSALLGVATAAVLQPDLLRAASGTAPDSATALYFGAVNAMAVGVELETAEASLERVMTTHGMAGMLTTVWLIICALTFGGALEASGILRKLTRGLLAFATSQGRLIASTVGVCVFFNLTAADHFLSIAVPGRLLNSAYRDLNLAPENLSRTLEDAGTVTSPLVPWSTCGAFHISLFGVSPLDFIPYCLFNILCPVFAILFGIFGFAIRDLKEDPKGAT